MARRIRRKKSEEEPKPVEVTEDKPEEAVAEVAEEPKAEEPKAEEAMPEEPKAEEPKEEAPKQEAPKEESKPTADGVPHPDDVLTEYETSTHRVYKLKSHRKIAIKK